MMLRSIRVLVAVLLVAGCAAIPPKPADNAPAFPPTKQVEGLRLPFDAYTFSLAELYTLANARDLLTQECMAARGHDWEVIDRPTDLADLRNRRRYGIVEIAIAEKFGYHAPAGLLTPVDVQQQNDKRENGLSESQKEAAFGPHGCTREATARLQPKESPDPTLLRQLSRSSLEDSQKEPRVAEAMGAWRDCIHRTGLDYQNPFAAISDPQWWANDSTKVSSQEIAVAVADVRCKEQTGLLEAWHTAEVKIQAGLVKRHSDYLREIRAAMEKELAAANTVLTRPGR